MFYCQYIDLVYHNINGNAENKNSLNDRAALLESIKGNEITQLQIEDAKLRDSVATIRNMIQNKCRDKVCKNCKIFEEQIASLKHHEKERLSFLEDKVVRLEQENKVLRQNSNLPPHNYKTSNNVKLDPQISLYITKLEQKSAYFEEQARHLQKDLAERNKQKQQDAIRIINLLDEIENCKREFQNMDRFYQNQGALMQQEKQRIAYELTAKLKSSQNEANNLKAFLETLNRQKDSLQRNLQAISSQSFNLKRQCEHLNVLLGESQNHLQTALQQEASKSTQLNTLSQDLSRLKEANISLSYKLAQQTQLNLETNKKLNALQAETANLKQQNFALLSRSSQETASSQEVNYLNKLLQQNKLILDSKEGQIVQMNHQIDCLKRENQSLNDCIKDQFSTIEKAERISAFQSDAIRSLERQRQDMAPKLMYLQAARKDLQQALQNEVSSKAEISQKLIVQVQRYGEMNKKYHNLEIQLQALRRLKIQLKEPSNYTLPNQQIARLKSQKDSLSDQISSLRTNNQARKIQIDNLNHQLQSITAYKEARQKDIEVKQKEIDQLIHFNNQIYNEIQQLKNENTNLISRIREIETIIYQLEQDNAVLANQNEELRKQKTMLSQLAENLQREKQSLIRQKQPQQQISLQQLSTLQTQLAQVKLENAEKQRLFDTERQSNMLLLNHKKQLEELNSQIISQNNRLKSRETQLLNQIKQQLSLKQAQISKLKSQLGQKNNKNDHNFNQSELDLINLQELYDENVRKYEKLAESERIANQNIIYLREKLESMNKVYSQQIDSKEHQELLKELNKKKQTITELLTNFKYLQKTLNKKEAQLDHLTEEHKKYCKQAQRQRFEMNEKLSLRQKQINALKKQREEQSRQTASKFRDMQKQIHNLQDQAKLKQKTYNEDKRKLEKEFTILTEEKRKRQQSTARQIINLKQTLQTQKKRSMESSLSSSPVKGDDPKKKQKQIGSLKKTINDNELKIAQLQKQLNQKQIQLNKLRQQRRMEQELMHETHEHFSQTSVHLDVKEKQLQQALSNNKRLLEEVNTVKLQLSKKNIELEKIKQQIAIKQKQHSLLQQNIRNIELKYQQLNKETTQKNLAYDYQWMQLDESKKKIHNLEKQLNENQKYLESIKHKNQEFKDSKTLSSPKPQDDPLMPVPDISGGTLPFDSDRLINDLNIKHVQSFTEPAQANDMQAFQPLSFNKLSIEEIPSSSIQTIYLAHEDMPPQVQKVEIPNKNDKDAHLEGYIKQLQKKSGAKNLLFQQTLSEAVSEAQQNDEINEMLNNKDSDHRSHKQLSVQEFSQYSRIKSTRSELNHKQVEEQYKNKIKNAKMLSKLSKPNKKK